ncbi:ubiquitin carboxyl-terminal hydrolase [Musa troglodytarum]|uniref:Ubiquitin carboxyl-terminal hydrolase n=1 Tax=Musa troglodytarum TaxID=320322 RepID=A0A9E7L0W5_9LILI|nr:ubiquitin carboxyl-terminal hydrolase [Musa troglodytarum]
MLVWGSYTERGADHQCVVDYCLEFPSGAMEASSQAFRSERIPESEQEVEPLFGLGYTGLVNVGNSCYMASTIQVVFTTRVFISRYYERQSLKMAFAMATSDPTLT